MNKKPRKWRPTANQLWILKTIAETGEPPLVEGMAAHGGMTTALYSLVRHGLIDLKHKLTPAGREAIK